MNTLRCRQNRYWPSAGPCLLAVCASIALTPRVRADDRDRHRPLADTDLLAQVTIGAPPPAPVAPAPVAPAPVSYVVENRGPVHEAYAAPVLFDPEPGLVVSSRPPDPIDEVPPDQYPDGDDVIWVPGYWGWDDDRDSFVWVSGLWRNMPPGRQFVPGYWRTVSGGYQWVSGFWRTERDETVQYMPAPPESLETGPIGLAPRPDHIWVPGVWLWRQTAYVWRPGFWIPPQNNWVWIPEHYAWTPSGCVFVGGYWDYVPARRGVLFAPIHVPTQVLTRRTFTYSPSVVVNVALLIGDLFARPRYDHFYFGDYYDRAYFRSGIYPVVSFHNSRYGCDPIFARYVATQRGVAPADYTQRLRDEYHYRRDHPDARPPRTYAALQQLSARRDLNPHLKSRLDMTQPLSQVARRSDQPFRYQPVKPDRITAYRQTITQTRQYQTQRHQLETSRAVATPAARAAATPAVRTAEPRAVQQPVRTVQQPARAQPAPAQAPRAAKPPTQTPARTAAPATPKTTQHGPAQPTQVRLQRSPLVSRERGFFDLFKGPPSQPKASAPDTKARPGSRSGGRREPKD